MEGMTLSWRWARIRQREGEEEEVRMWGAALFLASSSESTARERKVIKWNYDKFICAQDSEVKYSALVTKARNNSPNLIWYLFSTKPRRSVREWRYSFLTSALDGGEWSASRSGRFNSREITPGTHWTGSWVGSRAGLDEEEKRIISSSCREPNPGRPDRSLVALNLICS
jgi:hypothetical protein